MFADQPSFAAPEPSTQPRVWSLADLAIGAVLLFAAFLAVTVTLVFLHARGTGAVILGTVAFEGALAGIVLLLAARRGLAPARLGFRTPVSWLPLISAWFGSYVIMGSYVAVLRVLAQRGIDVSRFEGGNPVPVDRHSPLWGLVAVGIVVMVVAPLCEELFFRGFLYRAIRGYWGVPAGCVLSGLAFALFHLNLGVLVPFALIGALFAWTFETTGSLWTSIAAHALVNTLSYIAGLAVVSR